MGKRKSRSSSKAAMQMQPKKAPKLDTAFTCPFCIHPGSVECSIDLKHRIAKASCGVCKESYSEWIDECERGNEGVVVRPPRRGCYATDYEDDA
ncbi:transcription elongation factor 1 homolog [Phragmites australis]|uniref:transcription elongation factor 1 homolog n=1 Tax=Phragmites australis TaxID=29695 RepID=UPI002D77DF2F|nr:transcription elongation factor 1 homolog [Phragmites australis]